MNHVGRYIMDELPTMKSEEDLDLICFKCLRVFHNKSNLLRHRKVIHSRMNQHKTQMAKFVS